MKKVKTNSPKERKVKKARDRFLKNLPACIEKYICQDVNCKLISKRNLAAAVLVIKPSSKKVTKNS